MTNLLLKQTNKLKFGSLDGVYSNLEDKSIRPKLREKLENNKENAYLSYDLATIRCEAPIDFEPLDAVVRPYNKPELYDLFVKLEFVKLIDRYGLRDAGVAAAKTQTSTIKLAKLDNLPCSSDASVYIAGDGTVGVACEKGVCVLTPMEAQMGIVLPDGDLVCHDLKTTLHTIDNMGIAHGNFVFDTALAAYNLNPSQSDYPVSKLATNFLGISVDDGDAGACAEALWHLRGVLTEELTKAGMLDLYQTIELPLCPVLYSMEKAGVAIDRKQLEEFGQMLSERIADCESLIFAYSDGLPLLKNKEKSNAVRLGNV